ncbi:MAG TPA: hypothetical protein VGU45_17500 [Microvirga sp.]|jgi:hypothetical protein|nr:hypothetical protein [Microvirga sp.]
MRLPLQAIRDRFRARDVSELPKVIFLSTLIGGVAGWLTWLAFG